MRRWMRRTTGCSSLGKDNGAVLGLAKCSGGSRGFMRSNGGPWNKNILQGGLLCQSAQHQREVLRRDEDTAPSITPSRGSPLSLCTPQCRSPGRTSNAPPVHWRASCISLSSFLLDTKRCVLTAVKMSTGRSFTSGSDDTGVIGRGSCLLAMVGLTERRRREMRAEADSDQILLNFRLGRE